MRILGRKLLTAGLVALYGGIALLGYGLHELSPVHQHAAIGNSSVGHGAIGHAAGHVHSHGKCASHVHRHAPIPVAPGYSDSHECDVCVFLDQMRSERPQLVSDVVWQHIVADTVIASPRIVSQTVLGLHAPRGPPMLVG